MKKLSVLSLFVLFSLVFHAQGACAQNSNVSDYVPPPLFGSAPAPTPIIPKEDASDVIQLRQNENNPTLKKPLPKRPSTQKQAVQYVPDAPVPQKKPQVPKAITKKSEPIGSLPVKAAEEIPAKPKPTSEGVVKGPKTMPAVKKSGVDVEVVDEDVKQTQTDMLARVQEEAAVKQKEAELKVSKRPAQKPNSLFKDRLVLVFDAPETDLSTSKTTLLDEQVVPALLDTDKRLNIMAYASPTEASNADRRVALSRGLAVRSFLIEAGLKPSQINVRSLGSQTNTQPYDRVELDLIK